MYTFSSRRNTASLNPIFAAYVSIPDFSSHLLFFFLSFFFSRMKRSKIALFPSEKDFFLFVSYIFKNCIFVCLRVVK